MRRALGSPESRILDVGGLRVHVRVEGEGEPVLLLSGLGQPLESWDPFVASLGERRVVRFDAPGVGRSASAMLPASMASLASLAVAVLDVVGIDRADVVGFSLGGAVAQQLAYSFPARVRRLVLVATSCGLGSTPGRWDVTDALNASSVADPTDVLGLVWHALAIASWSSIPFLAHLTQPTLVVCGRDDVVAPPANGRVLASRIARAELVTLCTDHAMLKPGPATELAHVVERFLGVTDADPEVGPTSAQRPALASSFTNA